MSVSALLREYIPHAPNIGLFVAPEIPKSKLVAAIGDYAHGVAQEDVMALYDATRLGSGKDGALFLSDRLVYQNTNLQRPRAIRYDDIVRVAIKRQLLGGKKVELDVNQGRATVTEAIDFSAQGDAAVFIERFLSEVMLLSVSDSQPEDVDAIAVRTALNVLVKQGHLSKSDVQAMLAAIRKK